MDIDSSKSGIFHGYSLQAFPRFKHLLNLVGVNISIQGNIVLIYAELFVVGTHNRINDI